MYLITNLAQKRIALKFKEKRNENSSSKIVRLHSLFSEINFACVLLQRLTNI